MDVHRPDLAKARRLRRYVSGAVVALLVIATVAVARLKPAAPTVDRGGLFLDTVRRGEMLRTVRGTGILIPENVRWIPASGSQKHGEIVKHLKSEQGLTHGYANGFSTGLQARNNAALAMFYDRRTSATGDEVTTVQF